ncbi:MAG: hypothetical protein LKF37_05865 [Lentilactobacillus diolivorans]|jgi:hypothetical protein|nr:hypothetical protein [Lentilactobacillus diolivorans]RRG01702.1 MAG: hypothetical protein DUD34_11130 [Lactobacillus sp.]
MRHKKLAGLAVGLLLVVGGLSGCHSNSQSQDQHAGGSKISNASKTDMQNSSTSSTSSSSQSTQSNAQSSSATNNQSSTSNNSGTSNQAAGSSRIDSLNHELIQKLGNVTLPTSDGLTTHNGKLNVRYSGNQANYQILYSVGNHALDLNATQVTKQTPYASFQKKTYGSTSAAAGAIDYTKPSQNKGLPKVKLSNKVTGYENAGGGQHYLLWNEDNWSLAVHGSVVNHTDPKPTAVQTVKLLESYKLPVPNSYGAIQFNVHAAKDHLRDQSISWQDGQTVYTLKGTDINTAITMAASVK